MTAEQLAVWAAEFEAALAETDAVIRKCEEAIARLRLSDPEPAGVR